jgi:hypothetical protein
VTRRKLDRKLITVDMEHYYNGYLFNKRASVRVYNPTMALYCLSQIQRTKLPPEEIVDNNLRTDYTRLRRLIENEHNRKTLIAIMKNDGITAEIARSFSMDEMYRDQYFVSLLFYMGLVTIGHLDRGMTVWELKYLKKDDATEAQVATTLEVARAQLEKYRRSALFAARDDVKFAALLFIGKEQYQLVPLK